MASLLDAFRSPKTNEYPDLLDRETASKAHADYLRVVDSNLDKQYEQAKTFNRNRPPHVAVSACCKCGNFERHATQYKKHDYTNSQREVFTDEWLARECGGCNYRWNEAVITK